MFVVKHRGVVSVLRQIGQTDLEGADLQRAVEIGVAHGALAMSTPGDSAVTSTSEVEAVMCGENAAARR